MTSAMVVHIMIWITMANKIVTPHMTLKEAETKRTTHLVRKPMDLGQEDVKILA
jgi:hypothetical protein